MFRFRKIKALLLINVASKVMGFFRESYISYLFGISAVTDTFFAVQQVPTIIYGYMFGAFSLAFIPQYVQLKDDQGLQPFITTILKAVTGIGLVLVLLMVENRLGIIPRMLGIKAETFPLAVQFSRLLSISIIPVIVTAVGYGILHARQEHVRGMLLSALAPFVMLISMVFLSVLPQSEKKFILPLSFVAGSVVASIFAVVVLRQVYRGRSATPSPGNGSGAVTPFLGQLFASSIENVGASVNQLLNVYFAASIGAGSVAVNAYAFRIAMLPLSGIVSPANQMIHTALSKEKTEKGSIRFSPLATKLSLTWIAIAAVLLLLREPLVTLVYQRGVFSHSDTMKVASALVPYSCYFVVMAINQVYARYFFATAQGGRYSACLIAGYLVSNLLKPFLLTQSGLLGVIWACVIGEGLAALYFTAQMVYTEYLAYE